MKAERTSDRSPTFARGPGTFQDNTNLFADVDFIALLFYSRRSSVYKCEKNISKKLFPDGLKLPGSTRPRLYSIFQKIWLHTENWSALRPTYYSFGEKYSFDFISLLNRQSIEKYMSGVGRLFPLDLSTKHPIVYPSGAQNFRRNSGWFQHRSRISKNRIHNNIEKTQTLNTWIRRDGFASQTTRGIKRLRCKKNRRLQRGMKTQKAQVAWSRHMKLTRVCIVFPCTDPWTFAERRESPIEFGIGLPIQLRIKGGEEIVKNSKKGPDHVLITQVASKRDKSGRRNSTDFTRGDMLSQSLKTAIGSGIEVTRHE